MTRLLIKLFIKDSDNTENPTIREAYGILSGIVGIVCNLILSALKIIIGSLAGSISIIADGLNNLTDMGSSVISMIGFRLAGKPADKDHPFGHGRMEYMAAFIVAVIILLVGFELLRDSVSALIGGDAAPKYSVISVIALAISVIFKLWLFLFNRFAGKRIRSQVLLATAQDSINDVIATAVILVSVIVGMVTTLPFNLDAVMGVLVALFILWSGFGSAKETLDDLLGRPADEETITALEQTIMSFDGFFGIHDLIIHNYGPGRCFASVHVEVPYGSNIVTCHEQIDLCEKVVYERLDISLVIHMDPVDFENENAMHTRDAISNAVKEIDERLSIHDFRMTPKGDKRTNLIFDVVVPTSVKLSQSELYDCICQKAKDIDSTFCCVITFDSDFTGK